MKGRNQIKKIRTRLRMTQLELSKLAGITQPYLCDLENNRRGAREETYQRIADALDVEISDLFKKVG